MKFNFLLLILLFIPLCSFANEKNIPLSIESIGSAKIENDINIAKENAILNAKKNALNDIISLFNFDEKYKNEILNNNLDISYIKNFKIIKDTEKQENDIYYLNCSFNFYLNDIYKKLSKKYKIEKPKIYINTDSINLSNENYKILENKFKAMGFIVLNKNNLNIDNEKNINEILQKNNINFVLNISSFTKINISSYNSLQDAKTKSKNDNNDKIIAMINESDNIEKRIDADTNFSLTLFDINKNKEIYSIENKGFATGAAKENNTDKICSSSVSDAIDNIFENNIIKINTNNN